MGSSSLDLPSAVVAVGLRALRNPGRGRGRRIVTRGHVMAAARLPSLDRPLPLDGVVGGLVWDNHACMPLRRGETEFLRELADVHAAGVDIVTLNVGFGEQRAIDHFHMLATFRRWIAGHSDKYCLVGTEIGRAHV